MKGRSWRALDVSFKCGKAVERRKLVIREDQVNFTIFKRGQKLGTSLRAGDITDEIICFKELLNELRVTGIVLQQKNFDRRRHNVFFMLPGGGSLMTARRRPVP